MTTPINRRIVFSHLGALAALAFSLPAFAQYSSPMRDVDNPARQPVRFQPIIFIPAGGTSGTADLPAVPAGKRLVIETISFWARVQTGLLGTLQLNFVPMLPGAKMMTNDLNSDLIGFIGSYRLYYDPGSSIHLTFRPSFVSPGFSTPDFINCNVLITGYYVSLP
jgi:hypothetical protein